LVGAYKDDDNGAFSGSASVFGAEAAVTAPSLQLLLLQEYKQKSRISLLRNGF
jgi:hypothetical protein